MNVVRYEHSLLWTWSVISGVRRQFPRGGQVSSQTSDVTHQPWGKCRRQDHSRGSRGHAPGKILQNYT